jgi:hypothetical protein
MVKDGATQLVNVTQEKVVGVGNGSRGESPYVYGSYVYPSRIGIIRV